MVNAEIVSRCLKDNKGCLLLGSHLGSFDLLRFLAEQNHDVTLKIVIDKEPSQYINQRIYSKDPAIQSAFINANDANSVFQIHMLYNKAMSWACWDIELLTSNVPYVFHFRRGNPISYRAFIVSLRS